MHLWLVAHDAYNNNKKNEKNGGVANMQLIMHHFLLGGKKMVFQKSDFYLDFCAIVFLFIALHPFFYLT